MIPKECQKCIHCRVCAYNMPKRKPHCDFYEESRLIDTITVPQIAVFCENADDKTKADLVSDLQRILDDSRPQGEWIPVSERLPEHSGWYVVTREGMCRRFMAIVGFDAKYKNWAYGGVVAWIDAKPYTGGAEE